MPDLVGGGGLVLDTNVWLNLLATEAMEAILDIVSIPCHAPEQVVDEVKRHPVTRATFTPADHPLRRSHAFVTVAVLSDAERTLFIDLVGAPDPDGLGDGEAAVIAVAACRGLDIVTDDRKARRILRQRFASLRVYWTVDLLGASSLAVACDAQTVDLWFVKANRYGRMHIPRI